MQIGNVSSGSSVAVRNATSVNSKSTANSGTVQAAAAVQTAASAASAASTLLDTSYSTSVGGKNYSADVSQSGGTYTLAVPGLAGSSVSAASLSDAEVALNTRIDELA